MSAGLPIGASLGLEHVVFPVRNLPDASETFRQDLGFGVTPGTPHESGTIDNSIMFGNGGYVELLGIHDPNSRSSSVEELRAHLSKTEGPATVGVRVENASASAEYFRARGCEVRGPKESRFPDPETGQLSPPLYSYLEVLESSPYVRDQIFFLEKVEKNWQEYHTTNARAAAYLRSWVMVHPNTAQRLGATWLAVDDVERAASAYAHIGLKPSPPHPAPVPEVKVATVPLGAGSLLLAEPRTSSSPFAQVLARRGGTVAMVGISFEVASIQRAASALGPKVRTSEQYVGQFGRSFHVLPEQAHGAWLEFYETSQPGSAGLDAR
jgi:catechol 2,3-dioxygenase-like lactoylglutathione lyase family enzyme